MIQIEIQFEFDSITISFIFFDYVSGRFCQANA